MTMSTKEIYDNCIEACRKGDFTYIREHWRFLSSDEKLDIYYQSFKDKKAIFVYGQNDIEMLKEWELSFIKQLVHVEESQTDIKDNFAQSKEQLALEIAQNQLEDIIQDYAVSKEQLENVFQTHTVPDEYKVNEHRKTIYKNFAVYTRLREFAELFKKYPYLRTQAKYDYNLLKCNPRRIKARFEYMLYKNLSSGLKEIDSIDDLLLSKLDFSYIYQKEMLEVIYEWKEKDPEAHDIIWRLAHKNAKENETGESYFKYIDMAFIAAFGDEGLQKYIEQNREKSVEKTETNTQSEELKLKDIFW